ncbi:Pkinase-domain-containing protein [Amylocystis lapponica]|nr:Pkinase-domain-containing protein [Amylocystis lapponica]
MPNGHNLQPNGPTHQPPQPPQSRSAAPPTPKDPVTVLGIPSVTVENNQLLVGDSQSSSTRIYTPLKVVGDGSFGTVWLCDWHGTLPPNTPVSAMQCGAGARPEYAGKRLVAVKRMKKKWEGGWDECKRLKELESLRAIPYHPNIIPLYDFFLLPATKELYFVFESMEGNLYQLIKTRKGKPLAGGLVSSIFQQVVAGLYHIHASGYFHRDMKPENLLVTTTGLYDYRPVSPTATSDSPSERDVVVIVKLADFGLARETRSKPPYTEYVSTRWYRAPEVLLKSRDYSNPVDMWALGTIMAELVNLRPLFPGQGEIDQVSRICELLGDPCDDYGTDARGKPVGGGKWSRGVRMAKAVGFAFPKIQPKNFYSLFDDSVPVNLIECISDLLKYDPDVRLTSRQCLEHPYLMETTPLNDPPGPPHQPRQSSPVVRHASTKAPHRNGVSPASGSRHIPLAHSHPSMHQKPEFQPSAPAASAHIPEASSSHRSSFYDSLYSSRPRALSEASSRTSDYGRELFNSMRPPDAAHVEQPSGADVQSPAYGSSVYSYGADRVANAWPTPGTQPPWDAMDVSPQAELPPEQFVIASNHTMDIQTSPMVREYPQRPLVEPEPIQDITHVPAHEISQSQGNKLSKLGALGFGKKNSKWGLAGMFGHGDKSSQQVLPPVHENAVASAGSTPSLKRTQSSSTDSRSLSELSPVNDGPPDPILDPKLRKEEAKRIAREAEKQRRLLAEKMHRDQARAVMEKQKRIANAYGPAKEVQWLSTNPSSLGYGSQARMLRDREKGKHVAAMGPIRQTQSHGTTSKTVSAAGGSFTNSVAESSSRADWRRDSEREPKARRREFDDDHSMSSSDVPSGMSVISFATVDSDPGPTRIRHRPSAYGMNRMTSMSSLHTAAAMDEFSLHARSSTSLSLEQQLSSDFYLRASVDSSSLSDGGSPPPPPMHLLSLSSPPWQQPHESSSSQSTVDSGNLLTRRQAGPSPTMALSLPPAPRHPQQFQPSGPGSPYEFGGSVYSHPRSPGVAPKSAINPIFKVPPLPGSVDRPGSLPPFSQLEAVADGEYPPLSPMSFTSPDEMSSNDGS